MLASATTAKPCRRRGWGTFRQDRAGTTAVEFGLLAVPFFMFVLGIMAVGLQFFTINALDHATEVAARKIRTGEAQKEGKTLKNFREMVCQEAGSFIAADCGSRVIVHIQNGDRWADIKAQGIRPCAQNGKMTPQAGVDADLISGSAGSASKVVLITVCYDWTMPIDMPYLNLIMMRPADGVPLQSGGSLVQSVATFRTEPYE